LEAAPDLVRGWSDFEINIIKKFYGKKDVNLIAKLLKRTKTAVYIKANLLGLKKRK